MSWISQFFSSSIGKKIIMSLTGIFLMFFLVSHVSTNVLLFSSDDGLAFNQATKFLTTTPIIKVAEVGLALGFLFHIISGFKLSIENARSRSKDYDEGTKTGKVSLASKTMIVSGSIVFIFLAIHLANFYYPFHYGSPGLDANGNKDMYTLVTKTFSEQLWVVIVYVAAMILLGLHLSHGFHSAFRSMGWVHPKYTPIVEGIALVYSVIVPLLFASMPIYFYFFS